MKICQNFLENLIIYNQHEIIKKRKQFYYDDYEDSEESDSYTTEVQRRPKRKKNYEDEIDGIPEYEPHSSTESE